MNERLYISSDASVAIEPIPELRRVVLLRDALTDAGEAVPAGSTGTVLSVYNGGAAYCVEFTRPIQAEMILETGTIRAI